MDRRGKGISSLRFIGRDTELGVLRSALSFLAGFLPLFLLRHPQIALSFDHFHARTPTIALLSAPLVRPLLRHVHLSFGEGAQAVDEEAALAALSGLTGLRSLALESKWDPDYGENPSFPCCLSSLRISLPCDEEAVLSFSVPPALSRLTGLAELDVTCRKGFGVLAMAPALTRLAIRAVFGESCNVALDPSLSTLTGLRELEVSCHRGAGAAPAGRLRLAGELLSSLGSLTCLRVQSQVSVSANAAQHAAWVLRLLPLSLRSCPYL